jgi:erythrocyte band 7 integral membrane protein
MRTRLDRLVTYILGVCSWLFIIAGFPFSMLFCLRVVKEYERVVRLGDSRNKPLLNQVVFRLGSLLNKEARGPGLFFILPCIDTFRIMDLRVMSYDVPPQEILSSDSVTVNLVHR